MGAPTPLWVRQRVIEDWQAGHRVSTLVERHGLSRSSVYNICRRYKEKRWGMSESIRIDNGHPFGDRQRVTIPPLALWLIALNIRPIWNRPRRPTDNATVERMQGTTSRWAEGRRVDTLEQLQERLDRFVRGQREHYRVARLQGQTRLEAYPALKQPPRPYLQDGFEANRGYAFLAQSGFVRKVGSNGRITIYEQGYQVGTAWRHQSVQIQLDGETREWIIRDVQGQVIRRHKAKQLGPQDIGKLTVTQRT